MAMHSLKQAANPEYREHGKFLVRHNSAANFHIFEACCSTTEIYDLEMEKTPIEREHSSKFSMKNLLKKSSFFVEKTPSNFSQNRSCYTAKQPDNRCMQYIHSRNTSQIRDVNKSVKDQKMEQRAASRISFNYNKGRVEPSNLINNYNTTNYIVEKYIVQPQEMNIIMKDKQNPQPTTNPQPTQNNTQQHGRHFDLSGELEEEEEKHQDTPKWSNQTYTFTNEAKSGNFLTCPQQNGGNYHFSFGQNQKKALVGKMGVKEVVSNRQSVNQKESKPRLSLQAQQIKPEQLKIYTEQQYPLLKNSFKKTNLSNYERDGLKFIVSQVREPGLLPKNEQGDSTQGAMKRMPQPKTKKKYAD